MASMACMRRKKIKSLASPRSESLSVPSIAASGHCSRRIFSTNNLSDGDNGKLRRHYVRTMTLDGTPRCSDMTGSNKIDYVTHGGSHLGRNFRPYRLEAMALVC